MNVNFFLGDASKDNLFFHSSLDAHFLSNIVGRIIKIKGSRYKCESMCLGFDAYGSYVEIVISKQDEVR